MNAACNVNLQRFRDFCVKYANISVHVTAVSINTVSVTRERVWSLNRRQYLSYTEVVAVSRQIRDHSNSQVTIAIRYSFWEEITNIYTSFDKSDFSLLSLQN